MTLAVTMRGPLEKQYGPDDYQRIRTALASFAKATDATVVALDDDGDMSRWNLPAAFGSDPGAIVASLRTLRAKIGNTSSTLLVGGANTIPFWRMTNPVDDRTIDPDESILTDNPYAATSDDWEEYLAPSIPLGRLAAWDSGSAQDFIDLIHMATANREQRPFRNSSTAVVNADWLNFSQSAAQSLPEPIVWRLAPGYRIDHGADADTDRECLYFNLHGFSGQSDWKGYDPIRGQFVTAVTPAAFDRKNVSGTIVFAENCYGAQIIGRTPNNSCALRLVREGAAFVGATGLAYGSHLTPDFVLDDADELAKLFWAAFRGGLGRALCLSRQAYLHNSDAAPMNPFKRKTLLQFVLLGDPEWN
jgi:hypothetical protein